MRKIIWTVAAIGLAAAPLANAGTASDEEMAGVGAGGVIGAIAGGPAGLIIGAAIGAKIGDSFSKKDDEIAGLSASLQESRGTVRDLEGNVRDLNASIDEVGAELEQLRSMARPEVAQLLQAGIAMDLLFRTDEHVLADTTNGRLAALAKTIASLPDIRVQLDGFADERGDSAYNQRLSEKRVEYVKEQLIAAGVEPSRIGFAGHGESPAQDDSVDSYALERRVSVTLFIDDSPAFASNPE
ncbi:MAG: OmpA family protein [Woeseiaceae bacterium]|nr:OmpA family protein [Woeseiaceae bacterium]